MTSKKYTEKIKGFFHTHKRMPTYREIMRLFQYKSTNSAYKLVNKLIDSGFITRDAAGHLIPSKFFNDVAVLGYIEAGFPSPAEEELVDTMSLDEYLIKNKAATFMLKVAGDSMTGAGIMPGDMVLVERGATARNGDVVVAEVDGAWTLKTFQKSGSKIILMPANPKYQPIIPKDELNIAAVVRAVIRKY